MGSDVTKYINGIKLWIYIYIYQCHTTSILFFSFFLNFGVKFWIISLLIRRAHQCFLSPPPPPECKVTAPANTFDPITTWWHQGSIFCETYLCIFRSSPDGGTNFNPAFKGFTLSDYRTLKCFGFRPSRANWREILNFLEAYDRKECKWIECHNYYTFSGCYNAHCPYAHPPPIEIRYSNSL